jgi:imidazolonepropionase-like amidohydrolase
MPAAERDGFAQAVATTRLRHRAGVPILAGTDVGNPFLVPGYNLHRELELLVRAGLTPLAALQAATLNPARFLKATHSLGTVAPGKLADLVLLDANPLADIEATRRIQAVVVNGRLLDRRALDTLLGDAVPILSTSPPE